MPKYRILLAALAVVTIAVTVLFVLTPVPRPSASRPTEATSLVLRGYDAGNVTWEATANRGELATSGSALTEIVLRIFDGTTAAVRVSAQSLAEEEGVITLRGDVRGETDQDLRLSTDAMTWTENRGKLESGLTLLTMGTDELSAEGFAYDTRLRRAALTDVRGTLRRASTFVFTSDGGEVSQDEVMLAGNVRVTSSEPGFELQANSLVSSEDGWTATGGVSADIELSASQEDDDGT